MFQTSSDRTLLQRLIAGWLIAMQILMSTLYAGNAWAQTAAIAINPDRNAPGQRPVVNAAANGVPVVQIAPPSAAGVSNNRFTDYNVGSKGVVLNNTGANNQSQLAGWIAGNPMLGNTSAKTILNQVTGSAPSTLAGYTEVAGNRANVVVANSNGITCAGCGFINTPRVTLTTGIPELGTDGGLLGFQTQQGQIDINGQGLSARNVDQVDLISRSLRINAEVWANKLDVVTGTGRVDYQTGDVRAQAAGDAAPAVSLDVSQLGGMYANTIRLVGTESGVGVNSAGSIAALTGTLEVTQAGDVRITAGNVQSTEDINIKSGANISNASAIYAAGKISIDAQGNLENTGILMSGQTLQTQAGSLKNSGSIAAGVSADGKINAANDIVIATSGDLQNNGQILAGNNLTLAGRNMLLDHGKLTAVNQAVVNAAANLDNRQSQILANSIALNAAGKLDNSDGLVESQNLLTVSAPRIDNTRGSMKQTADADASGKTVQGIVIDNRKADVSAVDPSDKAQDFLINDQGLIASHASTEIRVQAISNIDGTLQSKASLTISGDSNVDNTMGKLLAAETLRVTTDGKFINRSGKVSADQTVSISAKGDLANNNQGSIQGASVQLAAASIDNSDASIVQTGSAAQSIELAGSFNNMNGVFSSNADNITLKASSIDNKHGEILHGGNGTLTLGVAENLNNTQGTVSGNGHIAIHGASAKVSNAAGTISSKGNTSLTASALDNSSGTLMSGGDMALQTVGELGNRGGVIQTGGSLSVAAGTLDNGKDRAGVAGHIIAAGTKASSINVTGELNNADGFIAGNGDVNLAASNVSNVKGTIHAKGSLDVTVAGDFDNQDGKLQAQGLVKAYFGGALDNRGGQVQGSSFDLQANRIANGAGTIQQVGNGTASIAVAGALDNADGKILSDGSSLTVHARSIDNKAGVVTAKSGLLNIQVNGALDNTAGHLLSGGALNINAASVDNIQGGRIQSDSSAVLTITGDVINTGGTLLSGNALVVDAAGNIQNSGGAMEVAKNASFTANNLYNSAGTITSLGDSKISFNVENTFDNASGFIGANGSVAVISKGTFDNTRGTVKTGKDLEIDTDKFINQDGKLNVSGALALKMKGALDNRGNTLEAQGGLTIHAASIDNSADANGMKGKLIVRGDGLLKLQTEAGIDNTGGSIGSNGDVVLVAGLVENGTGTIYASKTMSVTATTVNNQIGVLEAGTAFTSRINGAFDNNQGVIQADHMNLQAGSLNNRVGQLLQLGINDNAVTIDGEFNNAKGILASNGGRLAIASGTIDNSEGSISHKGGDTLEITGAGAINNNGGRILTAGALAIDAQSITNNLLNNKAGLIQSAKDSIVATSDKLDNVDGHIISDGALQVKAKGDVDNRRGTIQAGGALALNGATVDNTKGTVASLGSSRADVVAVSGLVNEEGFIGGNGDVSVTVMAGGIANAKGKLYANQTLSVAAQKGVDNKQGTLQANTAFTSRIGGALDNQSGLVQADRMNLQTGSLDNRTGKLLQLGAGDNIITVANAINNADGTIYSTGSTLSITTDSLDNTEGSISHAGAEKLSIAGAINNNGGQILTAGDLVLSTQSLTNNKSNGDAGLIQGDKNVVITAAGNVSNTDGSIISAAALTVDAKGDLDNRNGTLQARGALTVKGDAIVNTKGNAVSLDSSGVAVYAVKGLTNDEGFVGGNGNVVIAVQDGDLVNTKGKLYAKDALSIGVAGSLDNTQGTLQAVKAFTGNIGDVLDNRSGLVQAGTMDLQAGSLENRTGQILQLDAAADTASSVKTAGSFNNAGGVLASNNGLLNIYVGNLDNAEGEISHNGQNKLVLESDGAVVNNGGKLLTKGNLSINAQHVINNLLNGKAGLIQSGNDALISTTANIDNTGGTIVSNATLSVQAGGNINNSHGVMEAAKALALQGADIDNANGHAVSLDHSGVSIHASGRFSNDQGAVGGNGALTLSANSVSNIDGKVSAQNDIVVTAGTINNNSGEITTVGALTAQIQDVFNNAGGKLHATQITLAADSLDNNSGKLLVTGTNTLAVNVKNDVDNADGFIGGNGNVALVAKNIANTDGTIYAKKDLGIDTGKLLNIDGTLQADAALSVNASEALINQHGLMQADAFDVQTPSLDNSAGKILQLGSGDTELVFTGALNNAKGLIATNGTNLTLGAAAIDNSEGDISHAGNGKFDIVSAGEINNDAGKLRTAGAIAMDAQSISNRKRNSQAGIIQAGDNIAIATSSDLDNAGGSIHSDAALGIQALGNVNNTSGAMEAGGTLVLQGKSIDNSHGRVVSLDTSSVAINAVNALTNKQGLIGGNGDVTVAGQNVDNIGGTVYTKKNLVIDANTLDNTGGTLQADATLTAKATRDLVNEQGTMQANQLVLQTPNLNNSAGKILQLGSGSTDLVFTGVLNNAKGTIATNGINLTLAAASIDNSEGDISHAGNGKLDIGSSGLVNNNAGKLRTAGAVAINVQTLANASGRVQSSKGATIAAADNIGNANGAIISGGALTAQAQGKIDNNGGTLEAANGLALQAANMDNKKGRAVSLDGSGIDIRTQSVLTNDEGMIGSNGAVTLHASVFDNRLGKVTGVTDIHIAADSVSSAGGSIKAGGTLTAQVTDTLNTVGGNVEASQAAIAAGSLDNSAGKLLATGTNTFAITVANNANNTGGFIGSNGGLALTAKNVDNTGGTFYTKDNLDIVANKLTNTGGTLQADGTLAVTVTEELGNKQGLMQANQLSVQAPSLDNNAGKILQIGTGDTTLVFNGIAKNAKGTVVTNGRNLVLNASGIDNNEGVISHAGTGAFDIATGMLSNNAGQLRTGGGITVDAQHVSNVSGSIEGKKAAAIASGSDINNTGGSITSGAGLDVRAQSTLNNAGGTLDAANALTLQAADMDNTKGRAVSYDGSGLSVSVLNALINREGTIGGNGTVTLDTASIDNTKGQVTGVDNVDVLASTIINDGGAIKSQKRLVVNTSTNGFLSNTQQGVLQGDQLHLIAPNLTNAGGSIIQTGSADMQLQVNGKFSNAGGTVASNGSSLTISAQGINNNGGVIKHGGTGALNLVMPDTISNSGGTISSNGNAIISGTEIINTVGGRIEALGTLNASAGTLLNNNGGVLQSDGALTVSTPNMSNAGGAVLSDSKLTLGVPGFNNTDGTLSANQIAFQPMSRVQNAGGKIVQTGTHDLNLIVSQDIDNAGGTIAANGNISLGGAVLKNQNGTVRAAGNGSLTVNTNGAIDNTTGTLAAGGTLSATASGLNNQGGQITAVGQLALTTSGSINNNQGTIASNSNNQVSANSLSNRGGTVASTSGTLTINTPSHIDNTGGRLESGRDLSLTVPGLTNTNGTITADNLQINTQGHALDNAGGKIAARGGLNISSGQLNNHAGLVQANGALSINTNGQALINTQSGSANGIAGMSTVTLTTGSLNNQSGYIGAKGALSVSASSVDNRSGAIVGESAVALTAGSLNNAGGQIQGKGNVDINLGSGSLDNSNGLVLATGALTVNAGQINNSNTITSSGTDKGLQGYNVSLNASSINNTGGAIRADNQLTLTGNSLNNSGGTVSSAHTLVNNTSSINNTQGTLIAAKKLMMNSGTINGIGQYLSQGDLDFNYTGDYTNTSRMVAAGSLTINSGGTITNSGQIGANNVLNLGAANLNNLASGEIKAGTNNITVSNALNNWGIIDGGTVNLRSNGGTVTNYNRIYGDSLGVNAIAIDNRDNATIGARNSLTLAATDITNRTDSVVLSTGNMTLNAGGKIYNRSGRIESFGNLTINAGGVENRNDFLTMTTQVVGTQRIVEYRLPGHTRNLVPGTFTFNDVDHGRLVLDSATYPIASYGTMRYASAIQRYCDWEPCIVYGSSDPIWAKFGVPAPGPAPVEPKDFYGNGVCEEGSNRREECYRYQQEFYQWRVLVDARNWELEQKINAFNSDLTNRTFEDWYVVDATRTITETRASGNSKPGQIFVGGNLVLNGPGGSVLNDKSQIIVGGSISGNAQQMVQIEDKNVRQKTDVGTMQLTELVSSGWFGGHKRVWHGASPYSDVYTPENLGGATVWQFKPGTAPARSGNVGAQQTIQVGQSANGAADANRNVNNLQGANGTTQASTGGSAGGSAANPNGSGVSGTSVAAYNGQAGGNVDGATGVAANIVAASGGSTLMGSGQGNGAQAARAMVGNSVAGSTGTVVSGAVADVTNSVGGAVDAVAGTAQHGSISAASGIGAGNVNANAPGASITGTTGNAGVTVTGMQAGNIGNATGSAANSIAGGTGTRNNVDPSAQHVALAGPHAAAVTTGSAGSHQLVEIKTAGNGNLSIRSIVPTLAIPQSTLFSSRSEPGIRYLVETDPRFADYRTWLSSDFMLRQLGRDPANMLKRLGDGFYEQKLVADQIMYATGHRFVGDYSSNEEQYQALMQAGVEFGKKYQLTVGVALTEEQMKQLTGDIVWLVQQDVTLADGRVQSVLVPQVYVRVKEGDIRGDGTLIAAREIKLNLTGDLNNNALIATRDLMDITAQNINNISGGRLQGGAVNLTARNDLNNLSGMIAGNAVTLDAGRDINIRTTTIDTAGLNTTRTGGAEIAGVSGDNLTITAGRDLHIAGAKINAANDALLTANRNLTIGTVQTGRTLDIAVSGHIKEKEVQNVGSVVSAGGNLTVEAGLQKSGDLTIRGSNLTAGQSLVASGTNVTIESAIDTLDVDMFTKRKNSTFKLDGHVETAIGSQLTANGLLAISAVGASDVNGLVQSGTGDVTIKGAQIVSNSSAIILNANNDINIVEQQLNQSRETVDVYRGGGALSKKTSDTIDKKLAKESIGSTVSGDSISMNAMNDMLVRGSSVVGTNHVALAAGNNIRIDTSQNTRDEFYFHDQKASGLFSSGASITLGKQTQKETSQGTVVEHNGSTVGSVAGNLSINAGKDVRIKGSDLIAGQDVSVIAQNIEVSAVQDMLHSRIKEERSQSGLSLGISNPVLDAALAAEKSLERASEVSDPRLKALYAVKAAREIADAAQKAAANPEEAASMQIAISIGSSKSQSSSSSDVSQAKGSSIHAGRNVALVAHGELSEGDIVSTAKEGTGNLALIGTTIKGKDVTLNAANDIVMKSAESVTINETSNNSSGWSAGIGLSMGKDTGIKFSASVDKAKGNSNGNTLEHLETDITASGTLTIGSGRDTALTGAVVKGDAVKANIGGNLVLTSEQDIDNYTSKQDSVSAGGSFTLGSMTSSARLSVTKGKTDSAYSSVVEQTGIVAGNGGFDINVQGNTDLNGAIIASAADKGKNSLITDTLTVSDIENKAEYKASTVGISVSTGGGKAGGLTPALGLPSSDDAQSTTKSAISEGTITVKANQQSGDDSTKNLNRDTANANGSIQKIFDQKKVEEQQELGKVFGEQAFRVVGDIAQNRSDAAKAREKQASDELAKARADNDPERIAAAEAALRDANADVANWKEGGAYKVVLHGITAGVQASLGGGTISASVLAAMANESSLPLISEKIAEFQKERRDQLNARRDIINQMPEGADKDRAKAEWAQQANALETERNNLLQWGSVTVGSVAGAVAAGGSTGAQSGGASALTATTNNYLKHTELKQLADRLAKCDKDKCSSTEKESILKEYVALSDRNTAALVACTTRECIAEHEKAIAEAVSIQHDVLNNVNGQEGFALRGMQNITPLTTGNLYKKIDDAERAKTELLHWSKNNCKGISTADCAEKLENNKALIGKIANSFTPFGLVDDVKDFVNADTAGDKLLAIVGMAGPVGDAIKVVTKGGKVGDGVVDTTNFIGRNLPNGKSVDDFEKALVRLPVNERVAEVKQMAADVVQANGWTKDSRLTRQNGRDVYVGNDGYLYALDTQHGRFEKVDARTGKHQGEVKMNLESVPNSRDTTGGHDLKVK